MFPPTHLLTPPSLAAVGVLQSLRQLLQRARPAHHLGRPVAVRALQEVLALGAPAIPPVSVAPFFRGGVGSEERDSGQRMRAQRALWALEAPVAVQLGLRRRHLLVQAVWREVRVDLRWAHAGAQQQCTEYPPDATAAQVRSRA